MRSTDLNGLIGAHPDCLVAAYADIGTGVTLLTSTDSTVPREALDDLCVEAALTLGPGDVPPLGAEPCPQAIKVDATAIYIYLRAPDDPSDALICMCRPTIALSSFLKDARACFVAGAAEGRA
ncbi:MAG: hypothetical protein AAGK77_01925 [Pseudomonadota bacterium]